MKVLMRTTLDYQALKPKLKQEPSGLSTKKEVVDSLNYLTFKEICD